MTYDSIHECNVKLYASGMAVVYKKHAYGERTNEQLQWQSHRKRTYSISKIKVKSACVRAWQLKKSNNMLFLTFTFPFEPTEMEAANIWNRLLKNLKQNYNVKNYVWVKEFQKNGRIHYHLLIDRDRVGIQNLQRSYNSAITHVRPDVTISSNSVRLGNNPIVRSIYSVAKYLSKYISKSIKEQWDFETKAYGFSENLIISKDIDTDELIRLSNIYGYRTVFVDKFFEIYEINADLLWFPLDNFDNSS